MKILRHLLSGVVVGLLTLFAVTTIHSQEATPRPTVPDVTGMTVAQAAAILNKAQIRLGTREQVFADIPAAESGKISLQRPGAGETVEPGSIVNVQVQVRQNFLLIYDNNDITLVNQSGRSVRVADLSFSSVDGSSATNFAISPHWQQISAGSWVAFNGRLEAGQCLQIWSEPANSFKVIPLCPEINQAAWMSTILPNYHFWLGNNGSTQFRVMQNGVERGVCPVATTASPALECPLNIPFGQVESDTTEYIYLVYTRDELTVLNPSSDRWMYVTDIQLGNTVNLGDNTQYTLNTVIDRVEALAPGQCVLFKAAGASSTETLASSCFVIAESSLAANAIFWRTAFDLPNQTERLCPPAQANKQVICLMPIRR